MANFALKGPQPPHHVAAGGTGRGRASPPWSGSPGTSERDDSLPSSRASSRPSSPMAIDAGILPLALQVFNCGIQDLCAPRQAQSEYASSCSSSPQEGKLPQRYDSPPELENIPEHEQHMGDQSSEEEYTAARCSGRQAIDHRVLNALLTAGHPSKVRKEHEAASKEATAANEAEAHSHPMASPDNERAQAAVESQSSKQAPGVLQEPLPPLSMPQHTQDPDLQPLEAESPTIMGKSTGILETHNARLIAGQPHKVPMEQDNASKNTSAANQAEAHSQPTASLGEKRAQAPAESQSSKRTAGVSQEPLPPLHMPQLMQEPDLQPEEAESPTILWKSARTSKAHDARLTAGQSRKMPKEHEGAGNNENVSAAHEAGAHSQSTASPGKKRTHAAPESQPAKRAAGGAQKPLPPLRMPQIRQEPDQQQPGDSDDPKTMGRSTSISKSPPVGVLESLNTFADKFLLSSRLDFRASTKAAEQEAWDYLQSSLSYNPIPRATSKVHVCPIS